MRNLVLIAALMWPALLVSAAQAQELTVPKAMCDAGMFAVGDTYYSFEDIIVEGTSAIDLNDRGEVTAFGYLSQISLGQELFDQTTATISTVDGCYENVGSVVVEHSTSVDVVFVPSDFAGDAWKDLRRKLVRVDEGFQAKALVKLTGSFGIFSNTYGLYFRANSIDVVASFQ